ncbi:hypothetical protein ACQKCU_24845 [Heyndrickxia sporothermodurans]
MMIRSPTRFLLTLPKPKLFAKLIASSLASSAFVCAPEAVSAPTSFAFNSTIPLFSLTDVTNFPFIASSINLLVL